MTARLGRVAACLALALASARCADKIMAPVANAGTAVTVNMGSSVALDGRSSADPQGRPLAYDWSITVRPVLSQTSLNDAHIATPSFIPDMDGDYTIELVVSNGVLSSTPSKVTVSARKCSQAAPDITAAVAAPANPNTGNTVQLSATVHDADNDPACNLNQTFTLLWTAVARPGASAAALSDPAATSPTFVPDQIGTYQFSVVATDSTGLHSAPKFVTFKTTTCGSATPSITSATASSTTPNPGDTVNLVAVATDADNLAGCSLGQTLRFDWRVAGQPAGSSATLSDPTVSSPSITPDAIGTYVFVVTATDSTGKVSDPVAVKFTTTACGSAVPTITSATATPATPNIGTAVLLSATAADADNGTTCHRGQTLTLHWALVSRPATSSAFLDNPASASPSFTPDAVGTYQFSVTVSDGTGNTSPPTFVGVVVAPCGAAAVTFAAPAITAAFAEAAANVGAAVTLTAHPVDPAVACGVPAGPVQYVWTLAGPSGSSAVAFAVQAGTQFTFTPDVVGTYDISVHAIDARGQSASASTSVSTTTCGAAPIAVLVTPAASSVNSYQSLTLTATPAATSCPARFAPQIAWAVAGVGAPAQLSGSFGGTVSFRGTGPGDYTVSAVAINTSGHEGPVGTASVHVDACGSRPPVVVTTSNSPTFPARLQTVTLSATAVDPDASCGDARLSTIAFELLSIPQGSALSFPAGAISFQADVEGTYAFRVVATENGTGLRSDAAVLNVTVLDPSATASTVTATPATVAVGGPADPAAERATVTVTVRNRLGQPIGDLPVSVVSSGSGNTFRTPASGVTNHDSGVFVTTMSSTKAETKTFTATANPSAAQVVLNDHPSVTFIAGPATHVAVTGLPTTTTASNTLLPFTVTALDQFDNVATGYRGTVAFTSSDAQASFNPANHTFVAGDNGVFTGGGVALKTVGLQTVTATDNPTASITGTSAAVTVTPAAATSFTVTTSASTVTAGNPLSFTVKPRDPFNNVDTNYRGTANFTSTDAQVAFSAPNHPFAAGDNGSFTGTVTFKTTGSQTVTAKDSVTLSIAGTSSAVTVGPAAAASFTVTVVTNPVTAGVADSFTVTAKDAFGNTATGYTGTANFTSTDGAATFSPAASHAFVVGDAGVFTATATFRTAGSQTVTAKDNGPPVITGTSAAVTVNPAAAAALTVTGLPSPFPTGTAQSFTVAALDQFGNTATGYRGTVNFTSSDGLVVFTPASYTFVALDNGAHAFAGGVKLSTAGPQSVTAKDSVTASITGTQGTTVSGLLFAKQASGSASTTTTGNAVASFSDGSFAVTGKFSGTTTWGPGEGTSVPLNRAGATTVTGSGTADLFVARYNADGALRWVKTVGPSPAAAVTTIGVGIAGRNLDGSAVVVGSFTGTITFPTTPAATTLTPVGTTDLFIAKYDSTGAVLWVKQGRGSAAGAVNAAGIAGYADGTTVTTGNYTGTPTFGFGEAPSAGHAGVTTLAAGGFFLARYNADGTLFSVTSAGASGSVTSKAVSALADGTAVAVGDFTANTTFGAAPQLTLRGTRDAFAVKYGTDGTTVAWATSAGGAGPPAATASATAVAAFADGKLALTGSFNNTVTFGSAPSVAAAGTQDVFAARLNADGTAAWASHAGTASATGTGTGIAAFDVDGTAVVVGRYSTPTTFAFGATTLTPASVSVNDVFVARYTAAGAVASAKSAGGTGDDSANAVAGFSDTGALVIGSVSTPSSTFGSGEPGQTILNTGATAVDLFAAKYYPY